MGKAMDELASYFRPLAEQLIEQATQANIDPVVVDTGRTPTEQQVKIAQGVSWTNNSKHLPQPPEMKSEAIDIVPKVCMSMKFWGWNGTIENSHPFWGILIKIGQDLGLHCGVVFPHPDPGHFQYVHPSTQV